MGRIGLLRQSFFVILVAQVILSIANSLFILADLNVSLTLFGFYGLAKDNMQSLICYIFFCSLLSTILDVVRLLLWPPVMFSATVSYLQTLQNYYEMLTYFGIGLKIIGGIFAVFFSRKLQSEAIQDDHQKGLYID
eukprot:TRINITY_DN19580_c0_g1_i1.p1 TRINITY_DN19580_c0_g1~~TRINITY_DN19580_c0_g1_i1.p1  ORF type:complete len:136 (-),score=13.94 TRINITY_DN19580_c0_g1_i1:91-498(-)